MQRVVMCLMAIFLMGAGYPSASIRDAVSIVRLPNGKMDVLCRDHSREVVTEQDVVDNNICPHRPATSPPTSARGDIIWVIDNSGSMDPYQQSLRANMNAFIHAFQHASYVTDWRIGVVSTDTDQQPFIGFTELDRLDSQSQDPTALFNATIQRLGTRGSNTERPFEAVQKALTTYPGFLRQDAKLFIIVLTDEDDQSQMSVAQFVGYLHGKVAPENVFTYGIYQNSAMNCGTTRISRNADFLQFTGGDFYCIESPDYGRMLSEIGRSINRRINFN